MGFGFPYGVHEVANMARGRLSGGPASVERVVTDTREDVTGALFVALVGERFDGHDFAPEAVESGAAALLVSKRLEDLDVPQVLVDDTLDGLSNLAREHRARFPGKVLAVTGSSGKTTTRSLLAAIVEVGSRVHQPVKNFNNHIGVPLTILGLASRHQVGVFELGCSDFGEIASLTRLVVPDVAIITNIGPAHLEKLGDLEGVAKAKGEIFQNMPPGGMAVVNLDDPLIREMHVGGRDRITFGESTEAQVRLISRESGDFGQRVRVDVLGEPLEFTLPLLGRYACVDAVAAVAAARSMGIPPDEMKAGLEGVVPVPGRLNMLRGGGLCVIDDTYNANPSSMGAALEVLGETARRGKGIAVLGDMLELGDESLPAHEELGRMVSEFGLKALVVKGRWRDAVAGGAVDSGMAEGRVKVADDDEDIAKILSEILENGDTLLIKGSRGMRMEEVVRGLLEGNK